MAEAILRLWASRKGAALVGDPGYYGRFGFRAFPKLRVGDCPPRFIQAQRLALVRVRGSLFRQGTISHFAEIGENLCLALRAVNLAQGADKILHGRVCHVDNPSYGERVLARWQASS